MNVACVRDFRAKLARGFVFGPFSKTSDPAFVEVMGYAGFDFVILDLEHGPNSIQALHDLIRAAELAGLFPIVRTKEGEDWVIGEALDAGAGGVQVPQVSDPAGAERAVRRAKFAPDGDRGVCRFVRAARYSATDRFQYFREANECIVILQLEGSAAIANLSSLVQVKGVDVYFIGPYDLSQSLGVPGQVDHPLVVEKIREITAACLAQGIAVGVFADTPEAARRWISAGVRYISYSVDVGLFSESCRNAVEDLHAAVLPAT